MIRARIGFWVTGCVVEVLRPFAFLVVAFVFAAFAFVDFAIVYPPKFSILNGLHQCPILSLGK